MKVSKLDLSFCIAFFTVFIFIISTVAVLARPIDQKDYVKVTIQEGDTLWDLSEKYNHLHEMSNVNFINWVSDVNDIQRSYLKPGQEIFVPIKIENAP